MNDIRYLVTFSDGGVGMRHRDAPLRVGDELDDCAERYIVVKVEQPAVRGRLRQGLGRTTAGAGRSEP